MLLCTHGLLCAARHHSTESAKVHSDWPGEMQLCARNRTFRQRQRKEDFVYKSSFGRASTASVRAHGGCAVRHGVHALGQVPHRNKHQQQVGQTTKKRAELLIIQMNQLSASIASNSSSYAIPGAQGSRPCRCGW